MRKFVTIVVLYYFVLCAQTLSAQSLQSDSLFALGVTCYQNEEYKNAIRLFLQCDSIDMYDETISESRNGYAKMWEASSYYKLGMDDIAREISPKYFKYPPVDRRKTIVSDSLATIATALYEEEKYEEALEVLSTCANLERDSLGENSLWYKNSITECGYLCFNLDDYDGAIKYGEIAKNIAQQVCGFNSDEHIEALSNLLDYYWQIDDSVTIRKYLKELEAIDSCIVYEDKEEYANALIWLANCYETLEDYEEAVRIIIQANDIADKESEYRGVRCFNLFKDLIHLEKYEEAIKIGHETINTLENHISPSDSTYSTLGIIYATLAECYNNTGNYIESANLCQKAINIYDECNQSDNDDLRISALKLLSSCYNDLGLYEDAIKTEQEVIALMKGWEECDSLKYAIELSNLACYLSQSGKNVDAYLICEEAYRIVMKQDLLSLDQDVLIILSNLSTYYASLGNYIKAVELSKLVLSIRYQTIGRNSFEYATSLNNLATYISLTDNYNKEEAISLQKESIEIIESLFGKVNQYYIESLTNLAILYEDNGSPYLALDLYNEALTLIDSLYHKKDHPKKMHIFYNIANAYSGLKQYDFALDYLKKSYSIMQLYGLEENPEYINIKKGFYYLYQKNNNIVEVKKWMNETYNSVYRQVVESFPRLTSIERELFWNLYSDWFYKDLPQIIPFDSSDETARTLYNSCLLSKGILLSTNIVIDKLLEEEDPSLLLELQRLRQAQKLLEKDNKNDSIIYSKETSERSLLNGSRIYNGLQNYYKINYIDIKNSLGERDLAIEFVSMPTDSNEVYYALCLKKDYEAPHIIRLCDSSQLTSKSEKGFLDSLFVKVWGPLKDEWLDVKNIFFAPYGELHNIVIEYASGMEEFSIYRLSSTRELINIKAKDSSDDINSLTAILYGGIDYESQSNTSIYGSSYVQQEDDFSKQVSISQHRAFIDSLDMRGLKISYLPGTLTEIQHIKTSFEENHLSVSTFIGADATETSVKSLSGHVPEVLHIATHGFYFTESRAKKEVGLKFLLNENIGKSHLEDKSLIRSGLLFAGANKTLKGQDIPMDADDGILTAKEIAQLDLRGLDLVVLSACETGSGDIMQGEGVFGLQRGFKKAGVKSILMSLWKVSDIPTEMLMTEFYNNLCKGKTKRESLRLAQKKVREYKDSDGDFIFQDPYYWAGFVMLD